MKYRKAGTRTGCQAMVRYAIDLDGNWTIKKFVESHNHPLAESDDKHLLRSSQKISELNANLLRLMTSSGIRAADAFNFLATEVDGVENLECTKQDAYNFIQRDKRSRIEQDDVNSLLQLFMERQNENSIFAWDFQSDDEGRLTSFFLSDGSCSLDYDFFGDVIIFDTSYRLNKYNLCCATFVGINHHQQNVLFRVGFLFDETIESFKWLFKTFIHIMDDKHPITMFTDQDQTMARVIADCLPFTRHRLCQRHIYKKFSSKVHCGVTYKSVNNLFYKCMSKCDSEDEFEVTWALMIEQGKLHNNMWLDALYRIRHNWSTAFNKEFFGMGILSTQRSESTNSVCHGASKPTSSLTDCFLGLENIMKAWRRNEKDEVFKSFQNVITPTVKTNPVLRQAATYCTRKLYSMFEELLHGLCGLTVNSSVESPSEFYVRGLDNQDTSRVWLVIFDRLNCDITCSCKKFKMTGLLCSHCLHVLNANNIAKIPEKYLLFRWSAKAKKYIYNSFGYKHMKNSRAQMSGTTSRGIIFRHMLKSLSIN
ncbi:protein FAR1-RELATED SEQUENCE 5-like [Phalaenopsis equestris]|uniref:protein FAR1-RELATED SEQUENCE 5-like n=1 Tax=Phalaenopsis equestris TaxID=78828 RepID=UPI0009E632D7|nr:protein FAR1-RELATED SEQUENCE 5-like [Phalaenopsis equestris]